MHVEQYLQQMQDEGKSSSYLSKLRGMLFQVMNRAEANDLIRKNPVRFAEKMRNNGPVKEKDSFSAEEVHRLMQYLKHIEPDGSMIHVRQAVKLDKGVPYVGKTKSRDSVRDIPVPEEIRKYLIALRGWQGQTYVWESPRVPGRPVNPSSFRKDFKAALEKVGDVRLFTPHACRHTYVSQLQAKGVDMETIQSLVGHADTQMTEKYLHVQPEIKQAAIEKLGSLFKIA